MASSKGARQRKVGVTLQLPSHVQTNLNKEERLLQRNLLELDKEARQRMRCIVQDQKVAGSKLKSLEMRLLASQQKFHTLICQSDGAKGKEEEAEGGAGGRNSSACGKRKQDMIEQRDSTYVLYQESVIVGGKKTLRSSLKKIPAGKEPADHKALTVSFTQ